MVSRHAAVWREGRQELLIGPFGAVGEAYDVNSNATIVVGESCDPLDLSAWSWTPDNGVVCQRIDAPEEGRTFVTQMLSTSEDGRVIGGAWSFGPEGDAVLWIDGEPRFLKDYLRANGIPDAFEGWINSGSIIRVSRDGRVLMGQGSVPTGTGFRGYIVYLPKVP